MSFLEYTYTLSLSDRSTYVFTIMQNFINTTFKNTSHMNCHFHTIFITYMFIQNTISQDSSPAFSPFLTSRSISNSIQSPRSSGLTAEHGRSMDVFSKAEWMIKDVYIYRYMMYIYRSMMYIYRSMMYIYRSMMYIYRSMMYIYRSMMYIYRSMMYIYRSMMYIYL